MKSMKQIKGIIFDMDGILVESEPIQLKAMNLALAEYDVTLTKNQWKMAEGRKPFGSVNNAKDQEPAF